MPFFALNLYKDPVGGAEAALKYYKEKHVPLARAVPGVHSFQHSVQLVGPSAGDYFLAVVLVFDTMEALTGARDSEAGQRAMADLANFAGSREGIIFRADAVTGAEGPNRGIGIAVYPNPKDKVEFDRYYENVHTPQYSSKLPGMQVMYVSQGPIGGPNGDSTHRACLMYFEDLAAADRSLKSEHGQATAADVANYASGGIKLLFGQFERYP